MTHEDVHLFWFRIRPCKKGHKQPLLHISAHPLLPSCTSFEQMYLYCDEFDAEAKTSDVLMDFLDVLNGAENNGVCGKEGQSNHSGADENTLVVGELADEAEGRGDRECESDHRITDFGEDENTIAVYDNGELANGVGMIIDALDVEW